MDTTSVEAPGLGATFKRALPVVVSILALAVAPWTLTACGGGGGAAAPPPTYSINATVSGLSGTGLSLELNKAAVVAVSANGPITLGTALAAGTTYQVTVVSSPVNPMQTCTVANSSGTIETASVNLSVSCTTDPTQTAISTGLDSTLPQATVSMVAKVRTVGGSGALGTSLPRGFPNAEGETLLLGVDTNGHIVAAALTAANDATMSADSTALAFVRLLIAEQSTSLTAVQVNSQIRASPNFQPLVNAIDGDLRAQKLPLSDTNVVSIMTALANTTATSLPAAASRAQAKASVSVPVGPWQSGTQFTIIAGGPTYISSQPGSPSAQLVNKLAIPWSVSEIQSGASLMGAQVVPAGGQIIVPISNSTFNLKLEQTSTTLGMIANDFEFSIFTGFAKLVTKVVQTPACVTSVSIAFLSAAQKAANNTNSAQDLLSNANAQVTPSLVQSIFLGCAPTLAAAAAEASAYYGVLQLAWLDLASALKMGTSIPVLGVSGLKLVQEVVAANIYSDNIYDLKICAGVDYQVHSCIATLSIINPTLYMAPGTSSTTGSVVAKASDGTLTVLPGDLNADASSNLSVLSVSQTAGQITTTAADIVPPAGSIKLTVSDPATGIVSAPDTIFVVLPTLSTPQTTLSPPSVATDVTIKLIDPLGNAIPVPANITWTTTATSGQFLFKSSSAGQSIWTLPAGASPSGSFEVKATDAAGVSYQTLTLTLDAAGPGTCIPQAGSTTCSMTLYTIPYGNYSGFVAPSPGSITTVQTNNGVTTTSVNNLNPLGVTIYDNVNGPPLSAPICNYGAPGCPALNYHNFQLCAVDGKYTPVSYNSVVSDQVAILSNSGCTGSPNVNNIITSYTLSAAGILTGTDTSTASENETCTGVSFGLAYTATHTLQNSKQNSISMNLRDGSGNAVVSENRQSNDTNSSNPNGNLASTTSVTGTQSWPAESASPPQFPNTGIGASTTQVPAGQALPQACILGTP